MKVPVSRILWKHCWRIIPTRYPSENLLDRVVDKKDLSAIENLDGLTSTRKRVERDEISFMPKSDCARGPGSQYIMASFAYSLFSKGRFSDGSYGVYYAANNLPTAISETTYHREKFLRYTSESPMRITMRVLDSCLEAELHDIRNWKNKQAQLYNPKNYTQSQVFARDLWEKGSQGILYASIRHSKGECVAAFKPSLLNHCREERTLIYEWDGHKINKVYELQEFMKVK